MTGVVEQGIGSAFGGKGQGQIESEFVQYSGQEPFKTLMEFGAAGPARGHCRGRVVIPFMCLLGEILCEVGQFDLQLFE